MRFLLYFVFLIIAGCVRSQLQNNNWVFGFNSRITFNPTPNGGLSSMIGSSETCAIVSNETNGNLLFYTDGVFVWNSNDMPMPNGINLLGGELRSCTQGALIVPFPNDPQRYYLFTLEEAEYATTTTPTDNGLRYSIINMNLNGGLGDVETSGMNTLLEISLSEKLVVIRSDEIQGYWVLTHKRLTNQFLAYKINACGVTSTPVISAVGDSFGNSSLDPAGEMAVSPDGTRIGVPFSGTQIIQFFDFNKTTGVVSNALSVNVIDPYIFNLTEDNVKYGACFSPDGSKFYFSNFQKVYQLNLSNYNSAAISGSQSLISSNTNFNWAYYGQIEQGPNNKLYVARRGVSWLDEIPFPNTAGLGCGYIENSIPLCSSCDATGVFGLPSRVPQRFANSNVIPTFNQINPVCSGSSITLPTTSTNGILGSWSPPINNTATTTYTFTPNTGQCATTTTMTVSVLNCSSNTCNPNGNLIVYSNYDGGILTINVDQNIPNLKVGICTYEPIQVDFTGPFVGNITQVIYAGMNSNQNNNNCGQGNFTTSVTGVPTSIVTINPPLNPPQVGYTPAHGNGSGPWGGGVIGVAGLCDTTINAGGGNTPDEVVYYFLNATGGTLLYNQTQYACWVNETLNVSAGGNCCILPPGANPCPTVTTTSSQINVTCNGGSDGSATVVASGGTTFIYAWSPSGGSNATATGLSAGNYTCTITNECGNTTTQTFIITETISYQLNATVIQPTCGNNNGCIYFNPSPAGTYFYDWPFPTIMIVDSVCELAPGSYDITINNADGCPIDTTIILANSNEATIDANPETSTINVGDSVQLIATGAVSYTWNPSSSLTCFDCPNPIAQPSQNTIYIVTGTDTDGCTGSDTVVVNVLPFPQPNVEFPNVITPNSDGVNDLFEIQNLPENTEVIILNRWGNIVFSSDNYQNNWEGKDNSGKELVDGVHTYKFKTQDGKVGHGFVTLIR